MLQAENILFTAVLIGYFALTGLNFVLAIGKTKSCSGLPPCFRAES